MPTISSVHATFSQDVWPVATQLQTTYAGGGNGLFGGFYSGLDHKGPSNPYLKFHLGKAKVKTPPVKEPGIEVDWPEPLELPADARGTHLKVEALNKYSWLPNRPLGEATITLSHLPADGQVVDLQLRDVNDQDRPLMASVTFRITM